MTTDYRSIRLHYGGRDSVQWGTEIDKGLSVKFRARACFKPRPRHRLVY